MSRPYRFVHIDVFTARPFGGNPLAVFTDARGLTDDEMQTLAREMSFAESAFVLPPEIPGALRRVRIFTPTHEMPFAGHPTIGTTFVLAGAGILPLDGAETAVQLQLNIGLMPVTVTAHQGQPGFVWMEQRPAEFGDVWTNGEAVAAAIGVEPQDTTATGWPIQVVSAGVPYLVIPVRSLAAIRQAQPGSVALRDLLIPASAGLPAPLCAYLFTRETEDTSHTVHARMFSPDPLDSPEDAATGSAAGPLGAYLLRRKIVPDGKMVVEQGYEKGRPSLIHVEALEGGRMAVGGQAVIVGEGVMYLP